MCNTLITMLLTPMSLNEICSLSLKWIYYECDYTDALQNDDILFQMVEQAHSHVSLPHVIVFICRIRFHLSKRNISFIVWNEKWIACRLFSLKISIFIMQSFSVLRSCSWILTDRLLTSFCIYVEFVIWNVQFSENNMILSYCK